MTTVNAGTTGTYTFNAGQTVTVTLDSGEQARVVVLSALGVLKFSTTTSVSQSYGPFALGDVLSITAIRGDIDYSITAGSNSANATLTAAQIVAGGIVTSPSVLKIRRAIAAARASNPVINAPITSAQVTVTAGNNAGLTTFWRPDPASTGPQLFNMLGGTWIQYNAVPGYIALANNTISGLPIYSNTTLEWMSDAPQLVFNATAGTYLITVNDQPLISFDGVATDTGGGLKSVSIDWTVGGTITDTAVTRQARKYRVVTNGVNWIGRVATDSASRVWAPSKDDLVRAYIIGDSYTADTAEGTAIFAQNALTYQYSARLGFADVWKDGVGGSGFFAVGSGRTAIQAVPGAIAANPDIVIIPLGVNDSGQTAAVITPLVVAVLQALRAGLPNTPIVVVGPWAENTGPSANLITIENAVSAAVSQMTDSFMVFVPQVTDATGSWIFGTGNSSSGTGNVPLYYGTLGIHPAKAGHAYLGMRMASAIATALSRMLGVNG